METRNLKQNNSLKFTGSLGHTATLSQEKKKKRKVKSFKEDSKYTRKYSEADIPVGLKMLLTMDG